MKVDFDGWIQWICIIAYVIILAESIRSYLLHQKIPRLFQENQKNIGINLTFHIWLWKLIISFTLIRIIFFIFLIIIGNPQTKVDKMYIRQVFLSWLLEFPNGLVCLSVGYLIFIYAHVVHLKMWPEGKLMSVWGGKLFICFGTLILLLVTLFALLGASVTLNGDTAKDDDLSFRLEILQQAYWIYSAGVWMGLAFLLGKYKYSMYQFLRDEKRKHHIPTVNLSQLHHFAKANTYLLVLLFSRSIFCGYQFLRQDVQGLVNVTKPMVRSSSNFPIVKISHKMYEYFLWEFLWFIFLHQLVHVIPLTSLSSLAAERWQQNASSSEEFEMKAVNITYQFKVPRPKDFLIGFHEAIASPSHPIYEGYAKDIHDFAHDQGSLGPSSQVPLLIGEHEDA